MDNDRLEGYQVGLLEIEKFKEDKKVIKALYDIANKVNKRYNSGKLVGYITALKEFLDNVDKFKEAKWTGYLVGKEDIKFSKEHE